MTFQKKMKFSLKTFILFSPPILQGYYVIRNFKMDDHSKSQSFGKGQFRVNVKANSIIDGKEIETMTLGFDFHCE